MSLKQALQRRIEKRAEEGGEEADTSFGFFPTTPMELGTTAGIGGASIWGLNKLFGKHPMSLGKATLMGLTPAALPISAAFEAGSSLLSPLSDPRYQQGKATYFESWKEALRRSVAEYRRKGQEAQKEYGLLGYPLRAYHAAMNPITGLASLTGVMDKSSEFRARLEAEAARRKAEGEIHAV